MKIMCNLEIKISGCPWVQYEKSPKDIPISILPHDKYKYKHNNTYYKRLYLLLFGYFFTIMIFFLIILYYWNV